MPEQRQLLFENTAAEMAAVDEEIKKRRIRNCLKADPAHGEGVAKAMGIALADVEA